MFLNKPLEQAVSSDTKVKITIRVPSKLWLSIQNKAKREYKGRGKQSQLTNEAVHYFLKSSSVDSIDWSNSSDDYTLVNLLTQIKLGAMMKDLGSNPVQVMIDNHLMDKIIDLEVNIINSRKMADVRIKPALIRMALSQWMYADRRFLGE